ncbi:MAG TPA: hypothetical protein VFX16_00755 [Pseudonocardiaceae bacterium]|nr:hypothetical protein [Pseudonocardiaceae bacterium]
MSRFAALAAVTLAGAGLIATGAAVGSGVANAQQVCDASSVAGGEACFYSGRFLTGREFDISIPLGEQLPVPTDGGCVDVPSGFDVNGSVTNSSADTLYVFAVSCPDSQPGARPATVVVPHHSGNMRAATGVWARDSIRSVRMCGPGLAIDPIALTCAYLH